MLNDEPHSSAVIDTNLVVSSFLFKRGNPHELIQALYQFRFEVIFSDELLAEYADVLAQPVFAQKYGMSATETDGFLRFVTSNGRLVTPVSILPVMVRDTADNKVLAVSLTGDADYLVTGDKDLLVLAGDSRLGSLRIVTAAEFLSALPV